MVFRMRTTHPAWIPNGESRRVARCCSLFESLREMRIAAVDVLIITHDTLRVGPCREIGEIDRHLAAHPLALSLTTRDFPIDVRHVEPEKRRRHLAGVL